MPVRVIVTGGTTSDCSQAIPLIDDIEAECLLAGRAYDTDAIIEKAQDAGMKADRQKEIGKFKRITINIYTSYAIW